MGASTRQTLTAFALAAPTPASLERCPSVHDSSFVSFP
jgi:hypothetical protein